MKQNKTVKLHKWLLLAVCCEFITFSLCSQSYITRDVQKKIAISTYKYKIIYKYKYATDTVNKSIYYDKQTLEIGDNISHYYSTYADKVDSAWYKFNDKTIQRPNKSGADGINPDREAGLKVDESPQREDIFINYPNSGISTVMTRIFTKEFVYEEPVPKFEWKIQSNTMTILGYECIKAMTRFRGRDYEVWFTPLLPLWYGPWKFSGLPGLILKAADTKGYFEWTATEIKQTNNEKIYTYKLDKSHSQKVTRNDVINLLNQQWKDPIGLMFSVNQEMIGTGYVDDKTGKLVLVRRGDTYNYQKPYIPIPELE
jgi:GLPGLI family protein